MGFPDGSTLNTYLQNNRNTTQAAYVFTAPLFSPNVAYTIQYNMTQFCQQITCNNPQQDIVLPMQMHMNNQIC